jgi:tRNA pseudouridine38-40 synthase
MTFLNIVVRYQTTHWLKPYLATGNFSHCLRTACILSKNMASSVNVKRPRQEADEIQARQAKRARESPEKLEASLENRNLEDDESRGTTLTGGENVLIQDAMAGNRKGNRERNARTRKASRLHMSRRTEEGTSKAPRLPKRQCALMIGFCGTGCNGMQM